MTTKLKKHSHKILTFFLTVFFCFGCSEDLLNGDNQTVKALKQALNIGIEKAVTSVSQPGGYLNDAIKINLPEGAQSTFNIINALQSNPITSGLLSSLDIEPDLENTLTVLINSAAEDAAAPEAVNVFANAITNMDIADGKAILFGSDNAATEYLEKNTYTQLQSAFNPSITASLNTVKIAGATPVQVWEKVANVNNRLSDIINSSKLASSVLSTLKLSLSPMETNLSNYVTGKALDGLFTKVAGEELKIRTDASARITPLLEDVFGELDK